MLTDILIALPVVSVVLASTMYLQLQLIRKKQEELEEARKESLLKGEESFDPGASILTLSTCSSSGEDWRLVVQAYEIKRNVN